jgi:hypothetical protein
MVNELIPDERKRMFYKALLHVLVTCCRGNSLTFAGRLAAAQWSADERQT